MAENSSVEKVMAAGFRVFRLNVTGKKITECAGFGRWKKHGTYETQQKTFLAWSELMKDPKNISM